MDEGGSMNLEKRMMDNTKRLWEAIESGAVREVADLLDERAEIDDDMEFQTGGEHA